MPSADPGLAPDVAPGFDAPTAAPRAIRRLWERIRSGSEAGGRADSWRLALVVQGGAMRGVFTAGALCGLESLGARGAFDRVHGSSGGAVNAAYFLAGQVPLGTSIYYEDLNCRAFVDFRRLFQGTALGLDYCFDEVVGKRKALDLTAIRRSKTALAIHVTDAETAATHHFRQHDLKSNAELLHVLKASAAMPLVYRKPIWIRDRRTVDGALFDPVPLPSALAEGTTDVLVLLSRPLAAAEKPPQAWAMPFVLRAVGATSATQVRAAWRQSQAELARTMARLRAAGGSQCEEDDPALAVIAPAAELPVTRWTRDRGALLAAARAGATAVYAALGVPESERHALLARAVRS